MTDGPVVAFDLDGVLLRTDSFTRLVIVRLAGSPARLIEGLVLSPLLLGLAAFRTTRARAFALSARVALRGLDEPAYQALAARVGARLAAPGGPIMVDGVAQVRAHLAAGAHVVVVTASEHHLARAFLDAAGLGAVDLLASGLGHGDRFTRDARHNRSERKVAALRAAGLTGVQVAYSDSLSDLPMLADAARAVLVNPSRRVLATATRRLGTAPDVVRWS